MSIAWLMGLIAKLGPKIKEAWPHVLVMMAEAQAILVIYNEGKPISAASRAPLAGNSATAASQLTNLGIDSAEAEKVVRVFEMADDRLAI